MRSPPHSRVLPPAGFLAALVLTVLLHRLWPGPRWLAWPWTLLGAFHVLVGVTLNVIADGQFKRAGTTVHPFQPSAALLPTGVFRYSRNPMYLGLVLILTGVAVGLGSATPLAVIPAFIWWITRRFIIVEERALAERFGQAYADYRRRVRRWL